MSLPHMLGRRIGSSVDLMRATTRRSSPSARGRVRDSQPLIDVGAGLQAGAARPPTARGRSEGEPLRAAAMMSPLEGPMSRSSRAVAIILTIALIGSLNAVHAQRGVGAGDPGQPSLKLPPNPAFDQYKKDVAQEVDGMREDIQKMNDTVFSFGELGFQEFETSKYLTGILRKNGFTVEEGIAGIPTAFMATWGSGKPVIALGSDIDCIPQASQKPGVGYHDAIIEGAPGHGEGHNSGMPLQITAALAAKKIMEQRHLTGTIKVWPGVAEELVGTKAYYVRAGVFKDVDVVLFAHVGAEMGVGWGDSTQNGLVSVEYDFKGESAHAAAAPWRGRSALDAVELMDVGWNFRREHLRLQQRSHYGIPNGRDQPNVVPPRASGWYHFPPTRSDAI